MSKSPSGPTKKDVVNDFWQELVRNPFRIPILAGIVALALTGTIGQGTAQLLLTALLGAVIGKYYDILADAGYVIFEAVRTRLGKEFPDYADIGVSVILAICAVAGGIISFGTGSPSGVSASVASLVFFIVRALVIHSGPPEPETRKPS